MAAHSLTWQSLPQFLLEPLMAGALLAWEASELWDLCLTSPDEWIEPPDHLMPAVERLSLWQTEAWPTVQ